MNEEETKELIESKSKIRLDVACGANKRSGWIGMDIRPLKNVDIVHNLLDFPWPIPDNSACIIQFSHIMEHIPATDYSLRKEFDSYGNLIDVHLDRVWAQIKVMDEMWRVLEDDGQIWITAPYSYSYGFCQDPTHSKQIVESTFEYFDPKCILYTIYKPKPWRIHTIEYQTGGNILAVLNTRKSHEWLKTVQENEDNNYG